MVICTRSQLKLKQLRSLFQPWLRKGRWFSNLRNKEPGLVELCLLFSKLLVLLLIWHLEEKSTFLSGRKDHLRPVDIFKKMMPLRWNEPGLELKGSGQIIGSQLIKPKSKRLEGPNLQKSSKEDLVFIGKKLGPEAGSREICRARAHLDSTLKNQARSTSTSARICF